MTVTHQNPNQLRQLLRSKRSSLSTTQQARAAKQLALKLGKSGILKNSNYIAGYLAQDGEIDPLPLLKSLRVQGNCCYLPVLHGKKLQFARWHQFCRYQANRFDILEPIGTEQRQAIQLDVILLPLVAFDQYGNRLGMGGGFYDRTLEFKRYKIKKRPLLIGLAHSCQQVDKLEPSSWDIPLDYIATESRIFSANRKWLL